MLDCHMDFLYGKTFKTNQGVRPPDCRENVVNKNTIILFITAVVIGNYFTYCKLAKPTYIAPFLHVCG